MSAAKISTFRERFSALFDESEKTITELAKDLHVSNQTVSAWKTGARSPKEPTIITIANHFNVSVEWLMGFDVEKRRRTPAAEPADAIPIKDDVRLLIKGLNKLSPEQLKQATNVMRAMFAQYADYFKEKDDDA